MAKYKIDIEISYNEQTMHSIIRFDVFNMTDKEILLDVVYQQQCLPTPRELEHMYRDVIKEALEEHYGKENT